MADTAQTDVSYCQTVTLASQDQSIPEQKTACNSERTHVHTELWKQKHKVGSECFGTEEELGNSKLSGCVDEKLPQITYSDVVDFNAKQLPIHPNNLIESNLNGDLSSQKNEQETAYNLEVPHTHSELLEQKPKVGTEEEPSNSKSMGCIDEKLQQVTESKILDFNTLQVPTHSNVSVQTCLIRENLGPLQNETACHSECARTHSELFEQKHKVGSECCGPEEELGDCKLSDGVDEKLLQDTDSMALNFNVQQLPSHPSNGVESCSVRENISSKQNVPQLEPVVSACPCGNEVGNTSRFAGNVQDPLVEASIAVPRVEDEALPSPAIGVQSSSNQELLLTDEDVPEQLSCNDHPVMHSHGDNVNCTSSELWLCGNKQSVPPSEKDPQCTSSQQLCSNKEHPAFTPEDAACSNMEYSVPHPEDDTNQPMPPYYVGKNTSAEQLGAPSNGANLNRCGHRYKTIAKRLKRKYMLRSLGGSDRVLRSRNREKSKASESNTDAPIINSRGRKKGRTRMKGRVVEVIDDEYARIRKHLKYWLHRMSYEQSFIDAYSGEGWKGQSVEKLKPEKELQRAASEILRRKLKIRDLFQHLDLLCAEGRLAQSLFDSEGQIDSEDIFCAKCGSKDLSSDNDIILCDGACDRGFHQFCLEPPLLSENIPPGDESWLCPGCDCKDDCLELLNEFQGTNLDITDSWVKVFPEAAAIAAGKNVDPNLGLPSDESDDGDYNPNTPEDEDANADGSGSSSDETDYTSAPEELEASNQDPYLGLPSEDSEDDDYNPSAPGIGKKVVEGSSSDFTSDSEDLAAVIDADRTSKGSGRRKSKVGGKRQSLCDELSSLIESDPGQEGAATVSGKRHVERLDYKKLYDETYCNQVESSDDEEWTDTVPRRVMKCTEKVAAVSQNGKTRTSENESKEDSKKPNRRTHRKANVENETCSHSKLNEGHSVSDSSGKRTSSSHRRLGEVAIQTLYKSFRENQYPGRATKESLAQELGLKYQQVCKWFENYRWSFRHLGKAPSQLPSGSDALMGEPVKDTTMPDRCLELVNDGHLVSQECNKEESSRPNSRKRKRGSDPLPSNANHDISEAAAKPHMKSSRVNKVKKSGRIKTRRKRY